MTKGYRWGELGAVDGVTELRVHGVGGTTPESMLADALPVQVAGDRVAGFFRTTPADGRHVEAYSWGGLTSKAAVRALWLLLLPFTFANVAGWTQHHAEGAAPKDPRRSFDGVLVRLLGLSVTVLMVTGVTTLMLDIVAYQCGGIASCRGDRSWMWPFGQAGLDTHPGQRLVVGGVVPLALVGVLVYLGKRTVRSYEKVGSPVAGEDPAEPTMPPLLRPSAWTSVPAITREKRAHVAAGVATVAGMIALSAAALAERGGQGATLGRLLAALAGGAVVLACVTLVTGWAQSAWAALVAACIALVGAAGFAVEMGPLATAPSSLPGITRTGEALFGVQIVLLLALAASELGRRLSAGGRQWRPAWRYSSPVVLMALAIFMTGATMAGAMLRVADVLGQPADKATDPASATAASAAHVLAVPPSYGWLSILFTVSVAVVAVFLLPWVWWKLRPAGPEVAAVLASFSDDPPETSTLAAESVAKAQRVSALMRLVDRPVSAGVAIALLLAIGAYVGLYPAGKTFLGPWPEISRGWSIFRTAGSWVLPFLPVAAVGAVASGYRSAAKRRSVGILWDLGTFWPRWFHPLAPPSYSERAVPELQARIMQLTGDDGRVIVSAHSQGTIWTSVALQTLPPEHARRVAFVTYGSPLADLYPRLYPDHFPASTAGLADRLSPVPATKGLARWRNLWRTTDPIGGDVDTGDEANDRGPLRDPSGGLCDRGIAIFTPVSGHSYYLDDRVLVEHTDAVAEAFFEELRGRRPPDPAGPS